MLLADLLKRSALNERAEVGSNDGVDKIQARVKLFAQGDAVYDVEFDGKEGKIPGMVSVRATKFDKRDPDGFEWECVGCWVQTGEGAGVLYPSCEFAPYRLSGEDKEAIHDHLFRQTIRLNETVYRKSVSVKVLKENQQRTDGKPGIEMSGEQGRDHVENSGADTVFQFYFGINDQDNEVHALVGVQGLSYTPSSNPTWGYWGGEPGEQEDVEWDVTGVFVCHDEDFEGPGVFYDDIHKSPISLDRDQIEQIDKRMMELAKKGREPDFD